MGIMHGITLPDDLSVRRRVSPTDTVSAVEIPIANTSAHWVIGVENVPAGRVSANLPIPSIKTLSLCRSVFD